ncbi:hypothetical protein [Mycobacterium sp. NPDC006124]|uniref:hypothetical protein n=1 Tax=Mycobacterium sp. NPDC006124 TaxID=3156729 RepID=UPI0033B305F1
MNFVKMTARLAIAGAVSASALGLGAGAATALADGGLHQDRCFGHFCRHDRGNDFRFDDRRWDQRGFDDGRRDHRPFNYRGFRAEPFFDRGRGIWGFWFLGIFIPL